MKTYIAFQNVCIVCIICMIAAVTYEVYVIFCGDYTQLELIQTDIRVACLAIISFCSAGFWHVLREIERVVRGDDA